MTLQPAKLQVPIALLALHHCSYGLSLRTKHLPVRQLVPACPEARRHLRPERRVGPPLAAEPLLCRHKDVEVVHWETG